MDKPQVLRRGVGRRTEQRSPLYSSAVAKKTLLRPDIISNKIWTYRENHQKDAGIEAAITPSSE
jgi:hypothetical protein